jgi:hypothetical protein
VPLQAAQKLDISAQDRAGTNNDAHANAESGVSRDATDLREDDLPSEVY